MCKPVDPLSWDTAIVRNRRQGLLILRALLLRSLPSLSPDISLFLIRARPLVTAWLSRHPCVETPLRAVVGELPVFLQDRCMPPRGQVLASAPQASVQPDHPGAESLPESGLGCYGCWGRPCSASEGPRAR